MWVPHSSRFCLSWSSYRSHAGPIPPLPKRTVGRGLSFPLARESVTKLGVLSRRWDRSHEIRVSQALKSLDPALRPPRRAECWVEWEIGPSPGGTTGYRNSLTKSGCPILSHVLGKGGNEECSRTGLGKRQRLVTFWRGCPIQGPLLALSGDFRSKNVFSVIVGWRPAFPHRYHF